MKNLTLSTLVFFLFCITGHAQYKPAILKKWDKKPNQSILPDYSYAGYKYGESSLSIKSLPLIDVTDHGAVPNDNQDDTKAIQRAIKLAVAKDGGVVFFPHGVFQINSDTSKLDILRIDGNNIVLRGSGSGKSGTILKSGSATTRTNGDSPWLSPFAIQTGLSLHDMHSFYSSTDEPTLAKITAPVVKGDDVLVLSDTYGIKAGDVLTITMQNTTDEGNLMKELMHPLPFDHFQTSYIDAGKNRAASFQYPMEVKQVLAGNKVQFCQPMRRAIDLAFEPVVVKTKMLTNIGVENLRMESTWDGEYKHHGSNEMDYGWGAICFHRVAHGWIKDVEIENFTQTTHLVNSRNITINNVTILGREGHYGPKMYSSCDNLVKNIHVKAKRTHGPGLEGASFGNVYKDIVLDHPAPVDLHGIQDKGFCPPMYNLYENITNISKVGGGGAPHNTPHSGEYNTLWNLEIEGWKQDVFTEVFYSWIWTDPVRFKNEMHTDCHKQYLRTIVINCIPKKRLLTIDGYRGDQENEWIYVENLNSRRKILSLYDFQFQKRVGKNISVEKYQKKQTVDVKNRS